MKSDGAGVSFCGFGDAMAWFYIGFRQSSPLEGVTRVKRLGRDATALWGPISMYRENDWRADDSLCFWITLAVPSKYHTKNGWSVCIAPMHLEQDYWCSIKWSLEKELSLPQSYVLALLSLLQGIEHVWSISYFTSLGAAKAPRGLHYFFYFVGMKRLYLTSFQLIWSDLTLLVRILLVFTYKPMKTVDHTGTCPVFKMNCWFFCCGQNSSASEL